MEAAVYERLRRAAGWRRSQCIRHLDRCLAHAPADRPVPPPDQGGERR